MTVLRDDHLVMTRFPPELRRWRSVRRLSQLELAVRAGTTQGHASFIEHGRSLPGRSMVVRLAFATAADVTLAELHLEALLPTDGPTAEILRRPWA